MVESKAQKVKGAYESGKGGDASKPKDAPHLPLPLDAPMRMHPTSPADVG